MMCYQSTIILSTVQHWLCEIYYKIITIALIFQRLGYSLRTLKQLIPRTGPPRLHRVSIHEALHHFSPLVLVVSVLSFLRSDPARIYYGTLPLAIGRKFLTRNLSKWP